MRNLSGEESLLAVLPIVLVVIGLTVGILYYSKVSGDTRSRASYPTTIIPSITLAPKPPSNNKAIQPTGPSIACSQLYSPICGTNGITYSNRCELDIAGTTVASVGECPTPKSTTTPTKLPTTPKPTTDPNNLPSVQNFR